jgi:hypothetical protein
MYDSFFNNLWYRKRKWEAVRKHFIENDIAPIVHGLTSRKINNAIPFETVLQILTFVTNYASVQYMDFPGISYNDFCLC